MALVEIYHVVASSRTVDTTGADIKEGAIVSLNSDGEVVLQDATNTFAFGIAGDTKADDASSMPGVDAGWQNRVSDYFDETKASGKMTVYNGGGQFYTDQYETTNVGALAVGDELFGFNGVLDTNVGQVGANRPTAILLAVPGQIQSGVPGVDVDGDIALGSEQTNDNYIEVKLLV
jgi:hypothetical protein